MNVSLTPELEQYVNGKVQSGLYHSASEVIREGLRLLKEKDAVHQRKLEALRRDIQVGSTRPRGTGFPSTNRHSKRSSPKDEASGGRRRESRRAA